VSCAVSLWSADAFAGHRLGVALASVQVLAAAVAIGLSVALRGIACLRFGVPLYLALLYPVTIALTAAIAVRSMVETLLGTSTWKGRALFGRERPW
jgi:hypothetical protein